MSLTSIRLREAWDWGGLSFKELALRTYEAMDKHETIDRAAIVAYYAMLALVPYLGLVLTIALGASGRVAGQIEELAAKSLPSDTAAGIVGGQIKKIQEGPQAGILSISFLLLLWSSSSAFVAVMDSTNAAYGVRDARPWWKRRLMAILLTLIESSLLLGAIITIVAWPYVMGWFVHQDAVSAVAATVVQWLVVLVALLASFAIAYYFGPHVDQEWEWITPGSTIGVLVLVAASLGFRLYLEYGAELGGDFNATYGALAGVVILLLWLYLAALALLVGAEINCVIEHAAPHDKGPGPEGVPQKG